MLKKITGSNKFSHNGLKNKMLPKQVQLKVCVQNPYGQWECVGVLVRGAECPLLPGRNARHLPASDWEKAEQGAREGRWSVCMRVRACVCTCMRVHLRVHTLLQAAGKRACTGVCRCVGGGVFLYSEAR